MNTFLPDNYEVPQSGNYMKFEDGDNEFLILDSAILGYEYWNLDNKPVRVAEKPTTMPADIRTEDDGKKVIKHFWAFPVWNRKAQAVNVLEVTQKTVMGALQNLARSDKWGDPIMSYSITVTRTGKGFETEYNVVPNPKEEIPAEIVEAWEQVKADGFDITRLFDGGDPFAAEVEEGTARAA